jgi:hypothetical protein
MIEMKLHEIHVIDESHAASAPPLPPMVHPINQKNTQQSIGDHYCRKRKMGAGQNAKVGRVNASNYSSPPKKTIQTAAMKQDVADTDHFSRLMHFLSFDEECIHVTINH